MDQSPTLVVLLVALFTVSMTASAIAGGIPIEPTVQPDQPEQNARSNGVTMISQCQEITEPGHYQLANDIENSTANRCINIKASDVYFDGAGHTIDGVDKYLFTSNAGINTSTKGVLAKAGPHTNVTVTRITVTDYGYGIWYGMTSDSRIVNNTFRSNGIYGVYVGYEANNNLIANNVIEDIRTPEPDLYGQGIVVANYAHGNVIEDNDIRSIEQWGIEVAASNRTTVRNNTIVDTGGHGITMSNQGNVIVGNVVSGSADAGLNLGRSPGALVANNTFEDNNRGIVLASSGNTVVRGNVIRRNDQFGVHFHGGITEDEGSIASPGVTLKGNRIADNGEIGVQLTLFNNDTLLEDNVIVRNGDTGVRLETNSGNRLVNNTFAGNRIGVLMEEIGRTVFEGNTYGEDGERAVLSRRASKPIIVERAHVGDGTTVSLTGRNVAMAGAGPSAPTLPADARALSGVVTLQPEPGDEQWADIAIHYDGSITDDSTVELWIHDGSWRPLPSGSVNRSAARMRTNVTDLEGLTHLVVVSTSAETETSKPTVTDEPTEPTTEELTEPATDEPRGTTTATPGQPGFGYAVALVGLLLAGLIARARRD